MLVPPPPTRQRFGIHFKHGTRVGQLDVVPSERTGNRADMVPHPPTLIAGVVTGGRVGKTSGSGNCSQRSYEPDHREVYVLETATSREHRPDAIDVPTVPVTVAVDIFKAVEIASWITLGLRFHHVKMIVTIPVLSGIQLGIPIGVFAPENRNLAETDKTRANLGPRFTLGVTEGEEQQKPEDKRSI